MGGAAVSGAVPSGGPPYRRCRAPAAWRTRMSCRESMGSFVVLVFAAICCTKSVTRSGFWTWMSWSLSASTTLHRASAGQSGKSVVHRSRVEPGQHRGDGTTATPARIVMLRPCRSEPRSRRWSWSYYRSSLARAARVLRLRCLHGQGGARPKRRTAVGPVLFLAAVWVHIF